MFAKILYNIFIQQRRSARRTTSCRPKLPHPHLYRPQCPLHYISPAAPTSSSPALLLALHIARRSHFSIARRAPCIIDPILSIGMEVWAPRHMRKERRPRGMTWSGAQTGHRVLDHNCECPGRPAGIFSTSVAIPSREIGGPRSTPPPSIGHGDLSFAGDECIEA